MEKPGSVVLIVCSPASFFYHTLAVGFLLSPKRLRVPNGTLNILQVEVQ